MIRLRLNILMSYQEFRRTYILKLLENHALRLNSKDVIHAIYPESRTLSNRELKQKYLGKKAYSHDYSKQIENIPEALKEQLFSNNEINGDYLLRLVSGPLDPPTCITGIDLDGNSLHSHFSSLIKEIGPMTEEEFKACKSVFDYTKIGNAAYWLMEQLNVRTCPYCNRNYTTFTTTKSIRPDFDHYYPQSKFPYLSLSIFNLIPACTYCNRKKRITLVLARLILLKTSPMYRLYILTKNALMRGKTNIFPYRKSESRSGQTRVLEGIAWV